MGLALGTLETCLRPVDLKSSPIPYNQLDPRVFFELATAEGDPLGTVTFRLSMRTHPQLVDNFVRLCNGATNPLQGKPLSYKNTQLHAICSDQGIIVAGDVAHLNGSGGNAGLDARQNFEDYTSTLKIKRKGTLFMLRQGPNSDRFDSQFFVAVDADCVEELHDGVAFGWVEDGLEALDNIVEDFGTESGIPRTKIVITDCGRL